MGSRKLWERALSFCLALLMIMTMMPASLLVPTSAAVPTKKIYFEPGVWNVNGAWYQAWVWDANGNENWYSTSTDSNGKLYITVPADSYGMKWLRKSPSHGSNNWDKWNETGDIIIGTNNKCTITGWNANSFSMSLVQDTYTVDYSKLTNITYSNASTAKAGSQFSVQLTAKSGYSLPSTITVKVGGVALTSSTHYTYSNGKVTIKAQYVTGNIEITAAGVAASYSVSFNLDGVTKTAGAEEASFGTDYSATLELTDGYGEPVTIKVTAGGRS